MFKSNSAQIYCFFCTANSQWAQKMFNLLYVSDKVKKKKIPDVWNL